MLSKLVVPVSLFVLFVVAGCNSPGAVDVRDELIGEGLSNVTNSTPTPTTVSRSQAIDGYIVGADVYCDEQRNGQTLAAGWLTCASDTDLITVEGGRDVGFNAAATTGGAAFYGQLQGPGGAPYITPLTTIATLMSYSNGAFDRSLYDGSVTTLGARLGMTNFDLTGNPATNVELAKANAQLNALATQYAATVSDYEVTMAAIAEIISQNPSVDLTDSVANISAINEELRITAPHLVLSPELQASITENVDVIINGIANAESVEQIDAAIDADDLPVAFSIDRTAQLIGYESYTRFSDPYYLDKTYSLHDFEQDTANDGTYLTRFGVTGWNRQLTFLSDAFVINKSVQNANIDVAVDVQSMEDDRRLSVTIRGVQLSMINNDSRSIEIQVPAGTVMHATYVEESGIVTNVSNTAVDNLLASSADGDFSVNLSSVEDALEDHGYANFLREFGNYRMTLVLDGINFDLVEYNLSGSETNTTPSVFTVATSADSITGLGLQGYLSLIND